MTASAAGVLPLPPVTILPIQITGIPAEDYEVPADRIGVLLTSSYSESHKPRDSSNVAWERTTDTSRPAWFHQTDIGEDELKHTRAGLGLRAQAVELDGSLVDDFVIRESRRAIHILNAPSPGATASLAIGQSIAEMAAKNFQLKN